MLMHECTILSYRPPKETLFPGKTSLRVVYRMISKHRLSIFTQVTSIAMSITGVFMDIDGRNILTLNIYSRY